VLEANREVSRAEGAFDSYTDPGGKQTQIKRAADSGGKYDGLRRVAIDDGGGKNDLRGTTPNSTAIDPVEFHAAAVERVNKLFDAERQLLDLIR
jgi:hypothetical protein